MRKPLRPCTIVGLLALLTCVYVGSARAEALDSVGRRASEEQASSPALVTDLRFATLIRSNEGYFSQAGVFGFPVPTAAAGVSLTLGAEILPRVTVFAAGSYFGQGARRQEFGKLMLTSEALVVGARYAFLRASAEHLMVQLEGSLGGGKYWMRETFYDQLLSAQTFVVDANGAGFVTGLEASLHTYAFRAVVGYAYHYAPVSISNDIGGTAHAGGHEINFGLGVRL
jgi:hypothetical protein